MNTIHNRLRTTRKALGLTQKALADKADVSQVTIQHLESGRNQSSKKLPQIAQALGQSVDWLVTGKPIADTQTTTEPAPSLSQHPLQGPLVLTFQQAADIQHSLSALSNDPYAERAFLSPRSRKHFSQNAFAIYMDDNSMQSKDDREHALLNSWQEDDLLIFDAHTEAIITPGTPVLAIVHGQDRAIFRKYRDKGADSQGHPVAELIPLNEDYPSVTLSAQTPATIIGVLKTTHRESHRM